MIAEGVQGAVTGSEDVRIKHMCADDLTLLANAPDAMQTMLNRLVVHACFKHIPIKTVESEVVHFNSKRGAKVPILMFAGAALKCFDSRDLEDLEGTLPSTSGVTFYRTLNMTASPEHAATPMVAAAHQIHGSVRGTALCDRPFVSLWIAKACNIVPAGMYGCQVWELKVLARRCCI